MGDDLLFKPAAELGTLVRRGDLSARELVSESLRAIEALDPEINAFVDVDGDRALAAAAKIEPGDGRPFAGVPIAVKGNIPVAGMLMDFGSRFLGEHRPGHNAYLVRRLLDAGFVVVGITNLPEFGILPTTEPRRHGPTRNPWDIARTPGGSSGGSAAAVAAGMVPLAHGNDGGGSLRIPAACTGLVGLKSSRGRVSRGPDLGDSYLACDGVLTRTVAETAQLLDVLAGYEAGDANWAPRPMEPYALSCRREPGRLRIAMSAENSLGMEADPECVRGMRETAELLQSLGHEIVEASPALPGPEIFAVFTQVFGPAISLGIRFGELLAGRTAKEDEIEPLSRAIHQRSLEMTAVDHLVAMTQLQALARGVIAFFADYDLLLTPALAERPLRIGELDGCGPDPMEDFTRSGSFTPYTALFNVTGQPAISVPAGFGEDGLPTNAQLVAKPLGEETLLQVATQLEAIRPLSARRPPAAG